MSALGRFLKETRERLKREHHGYSLRDVASRIGLHHSYLSKLEKGDTTAITEARLNAIAREYGVDNDFLLALAGRLTERVSRGIYSNPSFFQAFIENIHISSAGENVARQSKHDRLEHRVGELETLTRLLRDEIQSRQKLEKALRQAQLEKDTVLSNLRDMVIYFLDKDLRILWTSPNVHTSREIIGLECGSCLEMCGSCDICPAELSLKTGKVYESSYVDKDGKSWLMKSVPVNDASGNPDKILLSGYDVTQLVEAREEIHRGKNISSSILRDIPALICRFSPSGEILYVNDEYCDYFGKTKEDMIGSNFLDFIPKRKRVEVWSKFTSLTRDNPSVTYEHKVLLPNGKVRWQKWTDRMVFDHRGRTCYQAIGHDITGEYKMRRQNTLLASIIENTSNICVIKDLQLRVIATNMAFVEASGHQNVEQLIGKTDAEIFGVSPDTQPVKGYMEDERLVQSFPRGKSLDRHEEVVYPDGTSHLYHTRKFPIYDENNILIATANISTNLTRRADIG